MTLSFAVTDPRVAAEQHLEAVAEEADGFIDNDGGDEPEQNSRQGDEEVEETFFPSVRSRVNRLNINSIEVSPCINGVTSNNREGVNGSYLIIEFACLPLHHLVNDFAMRDVL